MSGVKKLKGQKFMWCEIRLLVVDCALDQLLDVNGKVREREEKEERKWGAAEAVRGYIFVSCAKMGEMVTRAV